MSRIAWGLSACLWFATLTVFRRDAAWELLLQGLVFLLTACALWSGSPGRFRATPWIAMGLATVSALGGVQLLTGQTLERSATALMTVRWLALAAWCFTAQLVLPGVRAKFLELLTHGAGLFALLSLLMWATSAGRVYWLWPTSGGDVLGPWINQNHFAVWCELMLAPAIWLAAGKPHFWWAVAAILAAASASGSRAALALVTLELVLLWALVGRGRWAKSALAVALVLFAVATASWSGDALWHKLSDSEPWLYRDQIWSSSVALWRRQPWLGYGLGTFSRAYPEMATFDAGEFVDHAHNDWLEWGVDGGLFMALLLLAGYLYACRQTMRAPWLLGLPIAGLHASVDYPMARFPMALWVVLLLALATLDRPRFKLKQRSVSSTTELPLPPQKRHAHPASRPVFSGQTALD